VLSAKTEAGFCNEQEALEIGRCGCMTIRQVSLRRARDEVVRRAGESAGGDLVSGYLAFLSSRD
jgi:hypothetical protein